MAAKTIDVTLATIQNVGPQNVSPNGVILCQRVRSVDDEQVFQSEALYQKSSGQPMHPNGATHIPPGQSCRTTLRSGLPFISGTQGRCRILMKCCCSERT